MSEVNKNSRREYRTLFGRFRNILKDRFDLGEDNATQEEVIANVTKGVEFRSTNLWVLICATFIASLGLNVNSTAVIIGAMLVSPLMGPIIGVGLSMGINDFTLLKKSLRNFLWMFTVSIITSTIYFLLSPYSSAQSELLARTSPTTYDVLIAFFGGLAGMLAQTRKDRTGTVISGVAIATALMPPLCTVGFGIATGSLRFMLGALYLFLINTVFIALASYIMVAFLKYEKKIVLDKPASKRMKRYVVAFAVVVIVPSTIMTFNILNKTQFETNAGQYINNAFKFSKTIVVDYDAKYHSNGKQSTIEVKLVGEPLTQDVIKTMCAQMPAYGIENTELVVLQADETDGRVDFSKIQTSYAEIIDEKNTTIALLEKRLTSLHAVDTIAVSDIAKEIPHIVDGIDAVSLTKQVVYGVTGLPQDTVVVAVVKPHKTTTTVNINKLKSWLETRLKSSKIEVYVEKQ